MFVTIRGEAALLTRADRRAEPTALRSAAGIRLRAVVAQRTVCRLSFDSWTEAEKLGWTMKTKHARGLQELEPQTQEARPRKHSIGYQSNQTKQASRPRHNHRHIQHTVRGKSHNQHSSPLFKLQPQSPPQTHTPSSHPPTARPPRPPSCTRGHTSRTPPPRQTTTWAGTAWKTRCRR